MHETPSPIGADFVVEWQLAAPTDDVIDLSTAEAEALLDVPTTGSVRTSR